MKKALVASATLVLGLTLGTQAANADTYTVKAGDTVSEIALAHGTTISAIANLNSLDNPNLIYVGDKLEIGSGAVGKQTMTHVQFPAEQHKAQQVQPTQQAPKVAQRVQQVQTQQTTKATQQVQQAQSTQQSQPAIQQQSAQPQQSSQGLMSKTSGQLSQAEINQVANEMASRTGESASTWSMIINRESRGHVNIYNSEGSTAFGLFQNMHISSGSVGTQVDKAVQLYHSQGIQAWQ